MSKNIAVSVQHVSKDFRLPHERADTVKSLFINPFNKNRKKFETQHALRDISFDIPKGEFFGIVGRNGSGKSTLLKIIAGIYLPTQGNLRVNGRLVPFIELGVGFNPELTGRENAYLNGALMGFSKKEVDVKYRDIVSFAELERFMDQKLKNYSSGMQVRLAFSVATILAESDILLIDEVLAVGDADFQRKCFEYFRRLKKNKKTVIFVSHDMNAIRDYCDRAILIDNSRVIATGTSAKVAREYDKLFLNSSEDVDSKGKKQNRWGNKALRYTEVGCDPVVTIDSKTLRVTTKLRVNEDMDEGLFGFSVKNSSDVLVLGTNTQLKNKRLKNLKKGEIIELNWTIPNIFGDGEYFINVSAETIAATPCDWWDEAAHFRVAKNTPTGMITYPLMELEAFRNSERI